MSKSTHPMLMELTAQLSNLAGRLVYRGMVGDRSILGAVIRRDIFRAAVTAHALRAHALRSERTMIPCDATAEQFFQLGQARREAGEYSCALTHAVQGLAYAPLDQRLWELTLTAIRELAASHRMRDHASRPTQEDDGMSAKTHPTIKEITDRLVNLSNRLIDRDADETLELYAQHTLRKATEELERFIPGFSPPPDCQYAQRAYYSAQDCKDKGYYREAMNLALRGLASAPHDPELWHLIGLCCFELGAWQTAQRCIVHACWICPSFQQAKLDLEAIGKIEPEDDDPLR